MARHKLTARGAAGGLPNNTRRQAAHLGLQGAGRALHGSGAASGATPARFANEVGILEHARDRGVLTEAEFQTALTLLMRRTGVAPMMMTKGLR